MNVEPFSLNVKVDPKNIDFLNKVFEGYDHICLVSTVNAAEGHIKLWGYGKTGPVKRVLKGLPFPWELMETEE